MTKSTAFLLALLLAGSAAFAVPSRVDRLDEGVWVVHDDSGQWTGGWSDGMGITHQNNADYQAKKVIDLSEVPPEVWQAVRRVRLAVFFAVFDNSPALGQANGLDEAFEVVVNGHAHQYATNSGVPTIVRGQPALAWYDFLLPNDEFVRGVNEIIIRKLPSEKNDDYLYLGIDRTEKRGNSYVTFDGKTWTQDKLTVPGGSGEYMVRLYLFAGETTVRATWRPGAQPPLDDVRGVVLYAGSRLAKPTGQGLPLAAGQTARLEWDAERLDASEPLTVTVEASAPVALQWVDEKGVRQDKVSGPSPVTATLAARAPAGVYGVQTGPVGERATLRSVTVQAALSYHPRLPRIDMCPPIAPPRGKPEARAPSCSVKGEEVALANRSLRARFSVAEHLVLRSLYNEYTKSEMVGAPENVFLFLVEVEGKRYAGSRDFPCQSVGQQGSGFVAKLALADPTLRADLTVRMEEEGLRMGLRMTNVGEKPLDFKVAFPHLAGLAVSEKSEQDYYFYPWGGGLIADASATLRRGYGDYAALYQVMDLFSPPRGGGLYIRSDDADGRYKVLALRKRVLGQGDVSSGDATTPTTAEYKWTNSLEAVPGTGLAYEYLRRTRGPGQSFAPAEAVLAAHPGDWHMALKAYADWAHRVWKFRPYPSRLDDRVNMWCVTWADPAVTKEGKYRTDNIPPDMDIIEPWCWWDWTPLGPWRTPIEEAAKKYPAYRRYFLQDPVTGKTMYTLARGDYDGYNPQWGGLLTFRQAVQTWQGMGPLIILYTDPFLADDNTKLGQEHGKQWGVVRADGSYVTDYESWNMCNDVAEYRRFVADTMKRVLRETGADGVRLDQYGCRGWACFSKLHRHTFEEPGCTEWQRACSETAKLTHAAMDEVNPRCILMTEMPGYDFLWQFLDGCLAYDIANQGSPLRPLECNTQRFYFPECKVYELDITRSGFGKQLWNGVAAYGWDQNGPPVYGDQFRAILRENNDAFSSRDTEALVPTLARDVYANRFSARRDSAVGQKTIFTLYNASGHTVDGPVLGVPLKAGEHLFDLLSCHPCDLQGDGPIRRVRVYLQANEVVCLVRLPRRLLVSREGDALEVRAQFPPVGCRLLLCDPTGKELLSRELKGGTTRVPPPVPWRQAACVKLMRNGLMVDVAGIPSRDGQ